MATDESRGQRANNQTVLGIVVFLGIVALFQLVSIEAGTRGMGVALIITALVQQASGRIAYGWEGRPPSGYMVGWPALLLNTAFALVGTAMIIWPEAAMGILGWDGR